MGNIKMHFQQITLTRPIPPNQYEELIKHLYWVDPGLEQIEFDTIDPTVLRYQYTGPSSQQVQERLRQVVERLTRSFNTVPVSTIYHSSVVTTPGCVSPYQQLIQRGWVHPVGQGSHIYSGLMSQLYYALDLQFRHKALAMSVNEYKFPTLINLDTLAQTGYLHNFPHHTNFVCHLPEHMEIIEQFKQTVVKTQVHVKPSVDVCAAPDYALSPTVCYHFYFINRGRVLQGETLGATALSPCYRFESKATTELRRLREFNMREIMFIGPPAEIIKLRQALLDCQQQMLEFCQLHSIIQTAADPFFLDSHDSQRLFQISFDLKHEAKAYLPDDDDWLAIGSVNYHQDHFGQAFNITLASGEPAHSCCLGFGLDRWCIAIFAQYGLDITRWPPNLQQLLTAYHKTIDSFITS
mgnify:CR=1 FL=1